LFVIVAVGASSRHGATTRNAKPAGAALRVACAAARPVFASGRHGALRFDLQSPLPAAGPSSLRRVPGGWCRRAASARGCRRQAWSVRRAWSTRGANVSPGKHSSAAYRWRSASTHQAQGVVMVESERQPLVWTGVAATDDRSAERGPGLRRSHGFNEGCAFLIRRSSRAPPMPRVPTLRSWRGSGYHAIPGKLAASCRRVAPSSRAAAELIQNSCNLIICRANRALL
jgi:hypothetical protein